MTSPDIFLGPILRRCEQNLVTVCVATFAPFSLVFSVRKRGQEKWLGHDKFPFHVHALPNLHFYFGNVKPEEGGSFPSGEVLEYSIGVVGNDEKSDYSLFEKIVVEDHLSYSKDKLPTFFIQTQRQPLNALYGSCRKFHDVKGGVIDALALGDTLISNDYLDVNKRPAILCLGGDQIYADDVHKTTFREIGVIKKKIEGEPEKLPGTAIPEGGKRKDFLTTRAAFTSGDSKYHLILFSEYLATYGLAWNERNWQTKPDDKELSEFVRTLPKVRRLLANIPTYMIFDDHDVTDDWNLCLKWQRDVFARPLGRRIISNALAAFWLCQGYGNDSSNFEDDFVILGEAIEKKKDKGDKFDNRFWHVTNWEFHTPTFPFVYFLDTRTQRGFSDLPSRSIEAPAFLKSVESWKVTCEKLKRLLRKQYGRPLILLAAAPIFGFNKVEEMQLRVSQGLRNPYAIDLESWSANMTHMFLFLQVIGGRNVIVLSGDVHYSFSSTVRYDVFDSRIFREIRSKEARQVTQSANLTTGNEPTYEHLWSAKYLQLTSSALKNFADDRFVKRIADATHFSAGLIITDDAYERGFWVDGEFQVYNEKLQPPLSKYEKRDKKDLKPDCVLTQNINDLHNSKYLSSHNIGWITVAGNQVTNTFHTLKGEKSQHSWDFGNDRYWK